MPANTSGPATDAPGTTRAESFPRQHARTQRFTLGAPRAFTVAPDGSRVAFLRSADGAERAQALWVHETAADGTSREYPAADPAALLGGAAEELSTEERARRERSREGSAGIVGYATDSAVELAAFALSGRLFVAELRAGTARELPSQSPVVDPRPSPDGRRVAYASRGALRVVGADGSGDRALAEPEAETVTYGLAEFIAAEEMQRSRGFWWSPDSRRLLVARVDDAPVRRWWIADPAHPGSRPAEVAYPAAGTPNADVTLRLLDVEPDAPRPLDVDWDRAAFPYLVSVHWSAGGPPLLLVQSRDQRTQRYLTVDVTSGKTTVLRTEQDPAWLEIIPGTPVWAPDGRLVRVGDETGARALSVGDTVVSDPALHVRAVLDVGEHDVLFSASADTVGQVAVYRAASDGSSCERVSGTGAADTPHFASAVRGGDTLVLVTADLTRPGARAEVNGRLIPSYAETPVIAAAPTLLRAGARAIPTALLLPTGHREEDGPLPVLLDPYGGPHGQRVAAAHNAHLTSQWFADQGFAVLVADGRGTPGHSPAWEKAISGNIADVVLQDQVDALHALAADHPLDLTRVAIRGWSFGGYLAGLAALRRPDVFHAAVVGAPVTDLRLYDTHYQERYLGLPHERPEVYRANSLVADDGLVGAREPQRPMMIVHGLADDNVVVAHTLRLSSALLAAGHPHEVLPLSGVTHMTPQEEVAENLLLLQVAFLKRSLGIGLD
ncbi:MULTISPECIES: S9 family peptidase [unclassified Streptomyces]|uniref:S9 family peptidase n=1 Tax=unclassified Streptomyces TaxID=2593676 RepID=UPI0022B68BAC|nr:MULTISPECIES: prolyl oligopeptidase family serine peptidase [unclassified Streptomyces]MCZ7416719.1 prolyl oligopeptidase family serine peptidase [Streptomyces sp. WMMC897]MCZ7433471.1 prolyl oligopeptidase family serine peptidase [Streptomyces sp. WMMC1477]